MKRASLILTCCILWLQAPTAWADVLTLAQAQAEARAHAPEANEIAARIRAANAIAESAGNIFEDPTLSGRYTTQGLHDSGRQIAAGVEWTIEISGASSAKKNSAGASVSAARFAGADGLRALDEAVATAVADLAFAQRGVARQDVIIRLQELAHEAARRRLEVGEGDQLEMDATTLDAATARAGLAKARGERALAQARLARLLGRQSARDLSVTDPLEPTELPRATLQTAIEQDPRVQAAKANLRAAELRLTSEERAVFPKPTIGIEYERSNEDIPRGSFSGLANDVSAEWTDQALSFTLSFPLPLFERNRDNRSQARGDLFIAQSALRAAEADVRSGLQAAFADLASASEAMAAVSQSPAVLARDFDLLQRAVTAGALDSVARAIAVQRLAEASALYDASVRDLRIARARWQRQTASR